MGHCFIHQLARYHFYTVSDIRMSLIKICSFNNDIILQISFALFYFFFLGGGSLARNTSDIGLTSLYKSPEKSPVLGHWSASTSPKGKIRDTGIRGDQISHNTKYGG